MKVLNRELTEAEYQLFLENPKDHAGPRVMLFGFDILIAAATVLLIPMMDTSGLIFFGVMAFYLVQLFLLALGLGSLVYYNQDVRNVPTDLVGHYVVFGNSAIDFPFGTRSWLSTVKNLLVLVSLVWVSILHQQFGLMWFVLMIAATNWAGVWVRGLITLKLIDTLMADRAENEFSPTRI